MILVNGQPDDRITITDRGLQYGDGLFETLAYRNGKLAFLDQHMSRLQLGCQRLSIPFEQLSELLQEIEHVVATLTENAVVKVIITRGSGGRGYKPNPDSVPTRIVSSHPYPHYPPTHYLTGITVRYCKHTLSDNMYLAGIKHLNRLDQVIARNEWSDTSIHEGLMLDINQHVIEGTMSNLFIILNNVLITSPITFSGVTGIIRTEIIAVAKRLSLPYSEQLITKKDIKNATEVFVCNSVIGIWPVSKLGAYKYPVGKTTQLLQTELGIVTA
jgi:4-amino-4-deoxychorismate lyase